MVDSQRSDGEETGSTTNTRRQFVIGSAGIVGGLAAGSAFSGSVLGQEGSDDQADDEDSEEPAMDGFESDVGILNFALTLEYLEARFYKQGLDTIGKEGLCNCEALAEDSPLRDRAFEELRTIQEHEETHVETLRSVITDLGGEPIEEPEFDFGVRTEYPMAFLGTAVQLEDVGVSAYAGAAPQIEDSSLIPPALSIHSVEARHASFLRTLTDQTSFPEAFDPARSKSDVLEIASSFIVEESESPDGNETGTPDGNETEMPDGNETDTPGGNETDTPAGNETETTTN